MYQQIIKKTAFAFFGLAVAITGFLGGFAKDSGFTIGNLANAQQYLWCVTYCVNWCQAEAHCILNDGAGTQVFYGPMYHAQCC